MTFSKDLMNIPDDPLFTHSMYELGMPFNDLGEQPWIRFLAKTAADSTVDPDNNSQSLELDTFITYRAIDFDLPPNVLLHPTLYPYVKEVLEYSIQATEYKKPVWFINKLGTQTTAAWLNEYPRH